MRKWVLHGVTMTAALLAFTLCISTPQAGQTMERAQILKTLVDNHPRVLINESILDQVRHRIDTKADVARWYDHLKEEADELLSTPPSHYEIPDG